MMIDPKTQFTLWAAYPHISDDPLITASVHMPHWRSIVDLERTAETYRYDLQKKRGTFAKHEKEFSDTMIIKNAGTLEVCTPSSLAGLSRLIEAFMRHDLEYYTDTANRILELKFISELFGDQSTHPHIDDDENEIEQFPSDFLVSRGALVSSFASTIFLLGNNTKKKASLSDVIQQAPAGDVMLYRGDSFHRGPEGLRPTDKGDYRVIVRLLLRDARVSYIDSNPVTLPAHMEPRVTDRLVFTMF